MCMHMCGPVDVLHFFKGLQILKIISLLQFGPMRKKKRKEKEKWQFQTRQGGTGWFRLNLKPPQHQCK